MERRHVGMGKTAAVRSRGRTDQADYVAGAVSTVLVASLRRDRRNANPRPAKPSSIIAQVEGSGTALENPFAANAYVYPNP
jgi:hypothetical protein